MVWIGCLDSNSKVRRISHFPIVPFFICEQSHSAIQVLDQLVYYEIDRTKQPIKCLHRIRMRTCLSLFEGVSHDRTELARIP
jgi:hypothetical protein